MKEIIRFLIPLLVFFVIIRFFRLFFVVLFRFWFISIPLVILLYLYYRKRYLRHKEFADLDPDKEIRVYPEPEVKDEEE